MDIQSSAAACSRNGAQGSSWNGVGQSFSNWTLRPIAFGLVNMPVEQNRHPLHPKRLQKLGRKSILASLDSILNWIVVYNTQRG